MKVSSLHSLWLKFPPKVLFYNIGIKFHDPSEFKQEQQQLHQNQNQNPTNQHMGHRSRGHHHAAKLNIQNQDMQKTRE